MDLMNENEKNIEDNEGAEDNVGEPDLALELSVLAFCYYLVNITFFSREMGFCKML